MGAMIRVEPDSWQKLAILSSEAAEELTDTPATQNIQQGIAHETGFIYNAKPEGGGTTRLFKVLQTNACRFACPSLLLHQLRAQAQADDLQAR